MSIALFLKDRYVGRPLWKLKREHLEAVSDRANITIDNTESCIMAFDRHTYIVTFDIGPF